MDSILELPQDVFDRLVKVATRRGISPADWVAAKLPKPRRTHTEEEREAALERLRSLAGSIDMGHPTGLDNEAIDADLAREYADSHEDGA